MDHYIVWVHQTVYAGFGDEVTVMVDVTFVEKGGSKYVRMEKFFTEDRWEKAERVGGF